MITPFEKIPHDIEICKAFNCDNMIVLILSQIIFSVEIVRNSYNDVYENYPVYTALFTVFLWVIEIWFLAFHYRKKLLLKQITTLAELDPVLYKLFYEYHYSYSLSGSSLHSFSIEQLCNGYIIFKCPNKMKVGKTERVEAIIFVNPLFHHGDIDSVEMIKVSDKMKVRLTGDDAFEITPINSETQVILRQIETKWNWNIKPVKHGMHSLELIASIVIPVSNTFESKDLDSYRKDIKIKVSLRYSTREWFKKNWQFIVSAK